MSEVVGRRVRLVRKGREHGGLCPFHNEKTPSFTVSEEKGFYHCFGCGAHGDVISFVMETEGLSFPEAVERLAGEAGLAMPQQTPMDREQAVRRKTSYDVLEAATGWFEGQLAGASGAGARRYLAERGLSEETIKTFRIGLAPNNRALMKQALLARDITEEQLVEGGLLIVPEDGGESFSRFRDRVIFPITDRQGRVVAFGGRALGEAKAKYLNSPETILFHKGKLLFNLHNAREASREAERVVVVEGYMDVIALAQAGIKDAVAPLGTALTEDQLRVLWRLAPEPTLCFDGDSAGQRAAARAIERALPLLQPGYSLRFAYLPEGEDPDSLVSKHGPQAMGDVLDKARPLVDQLWQVKTSRVQIDTPERRAALQTNIEALANLIGDEKVKGFYRSELRNRLQRYFADRGYGDGGRASSGQWRQNQGQSQGGRQGQSQGGRQGQGWGKAQNIPNPQLMRTAHMQALGDTAGNLRGEQGDMSVRGETLILLSAINHPGLLDRHVEEFGELHFAVPELEGLRTGIIRAVAHAHEDNMDLDSPGLVDQLLRTGHEDIVSRVMGLKSLDKERFVLAKAAPEEAERGFTELLRQHRLGQLRHELNASELEAAEREDEVSAARARDLRVQISELESIPGRADGFLEPETRPAGGQ